MYKDAFTVFPILQTQRLLLRKLDASDTDDICEYAADRDAFLYTDGFPSDREEVEKMISIWNNEAYHSKTFIRWGIELKRDEKIIGGIYLFAPHGNDTAGRRMDIGYEISRMYWGNGYATEAIRAVTEYGFTVMNLKRIQAMIVVENTASVRACEKAGFMKEGVLRNYCHYERNGNCLKTMVMMSRVSDQADKG